MSDTDPRELDDRQLLDELLRVRLDLLERRRAATGIPVDRSRADAVEAERRRRRRADWERALRFATVMVGPEWEWGPGMPVAYTPGDGRPEGADGDERPRQPPESEAPGPPPPPPASSENQPPAGTPRETLGPSDVERPGTRGAVSEDFLDQENVRTDDRSADPRTRRMQEGEFDHRTAPVRPGEVWEWPVEGGGRMDRYDPHDSHVREIKPEVPDGADPEKRAERLRQYVEQVNGYRTAMEAATNLPHTAELSLYSYTADGRRVWRHFGVMRDGTLQPIPDLWPGGLRHNDMRSRVFGRDRATALGERRFSGLEDFDAAVRREFESLMRREREALRRRGRNAPGPRVPRPPARRRPLRGF